MAIDNTDSFSGPFIPNGVTTVFPFSFNALVAADVAAVLRDANGLYSDATGFTVAINPAGGGSITFAVAPAAGPELFILLEPGFEQSISFENGSAWLAEPVNEVADRSALRDIWLKGRVDRALKVPFGEEGLEVGSLAGADGKALGIVDGRIVPVANDVAGAEQIKADVEALKDDVAADKADVAADLVTVTGLRAAVAADKDLTQGYKEAAEQAVVDAEQINEDVSSALAAGTISDLIQGRIYATRALLEADLAHAAGLYAFVTSDPTPANRDLYQKTGSSGSGTWGDPLGIFGAASALAQLAADAAAASADAVDEVIGAVNMWPDPDFRLSAGDKDFAVSGYKLFGRGSLLNMDWNAAYAHPFGMGAWAYDSGSTNLMGLEIHAASPAFAEFALGTGSVFSFACDVVASGGTVSIAARFFNAAGASSYTYNGAQIAGDTGVAMDGSVKTLKVENLTWPSGAIGCVVYLSDGTASTFHPVRAWMNRGAVATAGPPPRLSEFAQAQLALARTDAAYGGAAWGFDYGAVWDDLTTVLAASGVVTGTSNAAITGWADVLDPAGVTFNAIAISGLTQPGGANPAVAMRCVIRKGAAGASDDASSTVVAKGIGEISGGVAIIPLRTGGVAGNYTSGSLTDISDTQLDTDEYVVIWQAIDANGAPTAIDQRRGTMPNRVGSPRSYYVGVGANPETVALSPVTGNHPVMVEHLLLDGIRDDFGVSPALANALTKAQNARGFRPSYPQRLRRFKDFAAAVELGGTGLRFRLGLIGDSWSTVSNYLARDFARMMKAKYGDGGVGWFGMGFTASGTTAGDAEGVYYATRTGTWTRNYAAGSTSPNVSDARSSEAGAIYRIRSVSGASRPALSDFKLQFEGTADGVIRWRWNGGAWSANTDVQGALGEQQLLTLSGFPVAALVNAAANADDLEIEVVSGSVILCGVDPVSATDGIVIDKFGASGSKATDWIISGSAAWQQGLALRGVSGVSILFGTNEDAAGQLASVMATAYKALADRVQAAVPGADMLIAVAPENQLVNSNDVTAYAEAISALADGTSPDVFAAFCDLQPYYGDPANKTQYADGGAFPLFLADGAHPTAAGARINARALKGVWEAAL